MNWSFFTHLALPFQGMFIFSGRCLGLRGTWSHQRCGFAECSSHILIGQQWSTLQIHSTSTITQYRSWPTVTHLVHGMWYINFLSYCSHVTSPGLLVYWKTHPPLGNSTGAGKPAVFRSQGIRVRVWCLKSSTCVIPYPYTRCCRSSRVLLNYSNLS
jgi:hypothetical protein